MVMKREEEIIFKSEILATSQLPYMLMESNSPQTLMFCRTSEHRSTVISKGLTWLCRSSRRGAALQPWQLFLGPGMSQLPPGGVSALCWHPRLCFDGALGAWVGFSCTEWVWMCAGGVPLSWEKPQWAAEGRSSSTVRFLLGRGILCFPGICLIHMTGRRRLLLRFENPLTLGFLSKDRWNKD